MMTLSLLRSQAVWKFALSDTKFDYQNEFMTKLRENSPKLFHLELRSGSGSTPGGHEMEFSSAKQSGDINAMLAPPSIALSSRESQISRFFIYLIIRKL